MKQKFAAPRTADSLPAAAAHLIRPDEERRVKASCAGPAPGRRNLAALALAIGAFLIVVPSASAAPTVSTATGTASEASYTSVHLTGTFDAGPYYSAWGFEYSTDGVHWSGFSSQGESSGSTDPPKYKGTQFVEADLTGLKGGTEYFARLAALDNVETFEGSESVSSAPYLTFTTKPVNKPIATLNPVTEITLDSAHFSGAVYPNAPAGPLTPLRKRPTKPNGASNAAPRARPAAPKPKRPRSKAMHRASPSPSTPSASKPTPSTK